MIPGLMRLRLPRSLQSQLILSVLLGMAIVIVPFNIVTIHADRKRQIEEQFAILRDQGEIAEFVLGRWAASMNRQLHSVAAAPEVRALNPEKADQYLSHLSTIYPARLFTLLDRSGERIAGAQIPDSQRLRGLIANRSQYESTSEGPLEYATAPQCASRNPCFLLITPVFNQLVDQSAMQTISPNGYLVMQMDLAQTSEDSGLANQFDLIHVGSKRSSGDAGALSLQDGIFKGSELFLISRSGRLLFPVSLINDSLSLQTLPQLLKGPWGAIVKRGMVHTPAGRFEEITAAGHVYLVYTAPVNDNWNAVAISDKESTNRQIFDRIQGMVLNQIVLLIAVTVVIALVCRQATKPILLAAEAVRNLSKGEFGVHLPLERNDDVGVLYRNIHQTGASLQQLMNERLQHAITDQQLETAAQIQHEFLIQQDLSDANATIAATFDPAYQIGADWYDVVHVQDVTYVVVADVCDKGIPSALFMSVFRSLLRYSLSQQDGAKSDDDISTRMVDTLQCVNDYMVANHGSSAMFATVFMGAYATKAHQLLYICAGHEKPLVVRGHGELEALEPSGPAIGIFGGAHYQVRSTSFRANDVLFAYSDGLVDARSPQGASFGLDRLTQILAQVDAPACDVEALLSRIKAEVATHRGDAEQFDDMTLLVMKAKGA